MNTTTTTTATADNLNLNQIADLVEDIGLEFAMEIGAEIVAADEVAALEAFCTFNIIKRRVEDLATFLAEKWIDEEYLVLVNAEGAALLDILGESHTTRNGSTMWELPNDADGYVLANFITGGDGPVVMGFHISEWSGDSKYGHYAPSASCVPVASVEGIPMGAKGFRWSAL